LKLNSFSSQWRQIRTKDGTHGGGDASETFVRWRQ